ncbi:MAG: 5-bromo-4-chloroindolyl phosphate hydrolysis family protein [Clostridiales Family XIII bacterium]|nr:5-bromo-4-chloroindolyl phosphate hydrolysis family protein [Clostridiales Family XIII bacterium]
MTALKQNSRTSATVLFVIGLVGTVLFGVGLIIFLILFFAAGALPFYANYVRGLFGTLGIFCLVGSLLMVILLVKGLERKRLIARVSNYNVLFGVKTVLRIDDVAAETGIAPGQIRKDMRKARKSLHFDLYTDAKETALIKGNVAYEQYLECERLRRQREEDEAERRRRLDNPDTAPLETFKIEGYAMIDKIRAANFALPGEEISLKLSVLEKTMKRIFDYVERYPDKLPETRKLMNYHLPITLKLVEKYKEYEMMEFKPQNVVETKEEISKMFDTVNRAFDNFLESLSRHDTLDVSTDMDVLKQMLEQEGLTGEKFRTSEAKEE